MKTKYLVPQTEEILMSCNGLMVDISTPKPEPGTAPQRNGFAPGGGDLGGIPAA